MIFRLILIAMIMTSCGFEGEFDFAITEGGEHGQTKEVVEIEKYDEQKEIQKQTATTTQVNETVQEETQEFSVLNYKGSFYSEHATISVDVTQNEQVLRVLSSGANQEVRFDIDFEIADMTEHTIELNDGTVTALGIYDENYNKVVLMNVLGNGEQELIIFDYDLNKQLIALR